MSAPTERRHDSRADTLLHIRRVATLLHRAAGELLARADRHDASKLEDPERAIFDEYTPKLAGMTYGSDEYREALAAMKPALDHHYAHNSHHPEHHAEGAQGMDLFDVLEMLLDWKAATERHHDGDIARSIEVNRDRFRLEPGQVAWLRNTARNLGWTP